MLQGTFKLKEVAKPGILILYNSLGKEIFKSKVHNTALQLDVSTYSNGIYHVVYESEDGMISQGRLMKI